MQGNNTRAIGYRYVESKHDTVLTATQFQKDCRTPVTNLSHPEDWNIHFTRETSLNESSIFEDSAMRFCIVGGDPAVWENVAEYVLLFSQALD